MAITLRSATQSGATTKGSPLTHAELDANFTSFMASGGSALIGFLPTGTGATTRTVQEALRASVRSGDFDTAGHFQTAQALLTEKIGAKELRVGTGANDGIVFPSLGSAPFQVSVGSTTFNGQIDPYLLLSYNFSRVVTTEPYLALAMEGHYYDGADRWMELNFDYTSLDGLTNKRFLGFQVNRSTSAASWAVAGATVRVESDINAAEFIFTTSTGTLARSKADGALTTAATVITGLQLTNTTTGVGTGSPALYFVAGSAGGAKIFSSRLGGSGGVLHFATDNTSGTITDRWTLDEAGNFVPLAGAGQLRFISGSATVPGLCLSGTPASGLWNRSSGFLTLSISGANDVVEFQNSTVGLASGMGLAWGNATTITSVSSFDLVLIRDAANVLALRNGTGTNEFRSYGTYTSASSYQRSDWKQAKTTLSNVSGATVTASNLIPKGAFVIGVTTRVNTGLGVSNGTTGYQVGDGSDADRWGAIVGTIAGTDSDNTDATANPTGAFTAANNVVITAVGGNFDATGVIEVCVHYFIAEAD